MSNQDWGNGRARFVKMSSHNNMLVCNFKLWVRVSNSLSAYVLRVARFVV